MRCFASFSITVAGGYFDLFWIGFDGLLFVASSLLVGYFLVVAESYPRVIPPSHTPNQTPKPYPIARLLSGKGVLTHTHMMQQETKAMKTMCEAVVIRVVGGGRRRVEVGVVVLVAVIISIIRRRNLKAENRSSNRRSSSSCCCSRGSSSISGSSSSSSSSSSSRFCFGGASGRDVSRRLLP